MPRSSDSPSRQRKKGSAAAILNSPLASPVNKLPSSLQPQLATLVQKPVDGPDWIHEIKYDGYRMLAFCQGRSIAIKSRNGQDWTRKLPSLAADLASRGLDGCILDGELVALDEQGVSRFQFLQNALLNRQRESELRYMVFDLPYADKTDLRRLPLIQRKELLEALLAGAGQSKFSQHIEERGSDVFEKACQLGLEGIVSKKRHAPYLCKRSRNWLKVKRDLRQELVICGFTEPSGGRKGFGALHLASRDDSGSLVYAGKVGTGFDNRLLADLGSRLRKRAVSRCPLPRPPSDSQNTTWTQPELVAEIKYAERTADGLLRHAVFIGLRPDKASQDVRWERPAAPKRETFTAADGPTLTNPDRVLYPSIGATKMQIAAYYETVAEWMLPHVARRPLSLLRHPRGRTEKGFFQKRIDDTFPSAVKRLRVDERDPSASCAYVTDSAGLVALLQMDTLEIHVWNCRTDHIEKPDQFVMDLDPGPGVPSEAIVGAAVLLHDLLGQAGLRSFLKTTGGKGLHVTVPIRRGPTWNEVKAFSKAVAATLAQQSPKSFVTSSSKAKRQGRIYLDYLRNSRGATAIAPYSTRAREGAPVAMPLSWDEASASLKSNDYTIENVARRLSSLKSDPWADLLKTRQGLTKKAKSFFSCSPT